jgi:hypothetical protein
LTAIRRREHLAGWRVLGAENGVGSSLDRLLAELGANIGLPGLAFDDSGCCRLAIDDLPVEIERMTDGAALLLTCIVGELPGSGRETAMGRLLDANFLFKGTQGATLAVPLGSDVVVLFYRAAAAGLGLVELRQMLENFTAAGEHARTLLAPGSEPASAPVTTSWSSREPVFIIRG